MAAAAAARVAAAAALAMATATTTAAAAAAEAPAAEAAAAVAAAVVGVEAAEAEAAALRSEGERLRAELRAVSSKLEVELRLRDSISLELERSWARTLELESEIALMTVEADGSSGEIAAARAEAAEAVARLSQAAETDRQLAGEVEDLHAGLREAAEEATRAKVSREEAGRVARLLEVFAKLRDTGNTLVVIEHNLDVIKCADWLIDLGPEGGDGGGRLIAEGPPELVAQCAESYTGQFLSRVLQAPKVRVRRKAMA